MVGTPIGNLGDLSPRAQEALRLADVVVCEDTRRTRQLLTHIGVTGKRLVAADAHREAAVVAKVIEWLSDGRSVVVVSDAGMPGVSDPGSRLVMAAAAAGHEVIVVPGPSAALAALVVSGLPTERFCFEGFLPRKGSERSARLAAVAADERTTIIFESPLRVAATLVELVAAAGEDRRVAIARELTKLHEEVWRGTLGDAVHLASLATPRGEHVIVLEGRAAQVCTDDTIAEALRDHLARGASARDAASAVAADLGLGRRRVYEMALRMR